MLKISADFIVREFIYASDFYNLVSSVPDSPATNEVIDGYSKAPIDKPTLLAAVQEKFGLQCEIVKTGTGVIAIGGKPHYYS
jgi:hypothetical protein